MTDEKCCQSTPHGALLEQIMDASQPKSEREWAASREIESLRARVAELEDWKEGAENTINTYVDLLNERDKQLAALKAAQGKPTADTIESLRARVAELEAEKKAISFSHWEEVFGSTIDKLKEELAALKSSLANSREWEGIAADHAMTIAMLKAGQGEPICWLKEDRPSYEQSSEGQMGAFPVFTQTPTIPEGWQLARTDDIQFCIDSIRDWGAYASAYAMGKWDLAGDIQRAKAMLDAPKP